VLCCCALGPLCDRQPADLSSCSLQLKSDLGCTGAGCLMNVSPSYIAWLCVQISDHSAARKLQLDVVKLHVTHELRDSCGLHCYLLPVAMLSALSRLRLTGLAAGGAVAACCAAAAGHQPELSGSDCTSSACCGSGRRTAILQPAVGLWRPLAPGSGCTSHCGDSDYAIRRGIAAPAACAAAAVAHSLSAIWFWTAL
jgi:hypothetical protein